MANPMGRAGTPEEAPVRAETVARLPLAPGEYRLRFRQRGR